MVNEGYTWGKRIVKEKLYNKVASGQTGGGIRHTKSFEENVSEKRREGFRITPNDIRYVEDSS